MDIGPPEKVQNFEYFELFLQENFIPHLEQHLESLEEGAVLLNCECASLSSLPLDHPCLRLECNIPNTRATLQRISRIIPCLQVDALTPARLKEAFLHQVIKGSYFTWDIWAPGRLRNGEPWYPKNDATGRVSLNLIATQAVTIQFEVTEISEDEFLPFLGTCSINFDRSFLLKRTRVDQKGSHTRK